MITAVSLNPAIDRTILITRLERGCVNRIISTREDIGGKGINVAKILNRLKVPSQVYGFVGSQNKQIVEELLSQEELQYHFLETDGVTRTNTKIVELERGITTDLNEPGVHIKDETMMKFKSLLLAEAEQNEFVVFSGSIPRGISIDIYYELIKAVRGQAKTILDAEGPLLVEGMKAHPYMIKPNLHELAEAFNIKLTTNEDIVTFGKALSHKYDIHLILVSMGDKGSLLITKEECYRAEPIKVEVKSTVGAGDSMIAGMLYGLSHHLSIEESYAYATACGTLAVTKEGTQSFSFDEVQAMLSKVQINQY